MEKIFIVTAGAYSAYHIVGVFTDGGLAKDAADKLNKQNRMKGYAEVEEYNISSEKDIDRLVKFEF